MLKDGTKYLAQIKVGGKTRWEIISWGWMAMIVPIKYGWINQTGMGMKIDEILQFYLLDDITKGLSQ